MAALLGVRVADQPVTVNLEEQTVNLHECASEINFNEQLLWETLKNDLQRTDSLCEGIRPGSKRNWELERKLNIIDKQIHRLIQNLVSLADLENEAGGMFVEKKLDFRSPLEGNKHLYEQLFALLQLNPEYFARLAPVVSTRDIPDFVKTVIFDMYGDQYDSREERLLLTLFRSVLAKCFEDAEDMGSFLRANTAITQMLSAYARRGQGLGILRDILSKPIQEMLSQNNLNLEINPVEVYKQIITSYEAKMNRPWDGPRNPTPEEAAENKYVKKLTPPRVKQLEYIGEHFLSRVIEDVDSIPYGIRWICKQLAEMAQRKFPHADRYQIGGLVGGYIYLRFFNPVVVAPESVNFVQKKPSKTMRRNLILVAKILQNLSNGVEFRDEYMRALSPWIERHREDIQTYFARLIDVDDLEDRMDVDKLLAHARRRENTVQISFNQIFLIHRLLQSHKGLWMSGPEDPVLKVLAQLGPAPDKVPHSENHTINIRLPTLDDDSKNSRDEEDTSAVDGNDPTLALFGFRVSEQVVAVRQRIQRLLTNPAVPRRFMDQFENSFRAYLYNVLNWAKDEQNIVILNDVEQIIVGLNSHITQNGGVAEDLGEFNSFLLQYVNQVREMKRRADRAHEKMMAVEQAEATIASHYHYLQTKLEYYEQYLGNVKRGGNTDHPRSEATAAHERNAGKVVKFSHRELENMGIITDLDETALSQLNKARKDKLTYYFTQAGPDEFEITVKLRVGMGAKINPFNKPFLINLSNLLEMQEQHQSRYTLENLVTLQVNLLINLLNHNFLRTD